jgi:hypothetical protein
MMGHFSEQLWSDYCGKMRLGVIGGVSAGERASLSRAYDRSLVVYSWLTAHIARHYQAELQVAPPIASRVFHELALGHNDFMQARKISDIPYPFPFEQMNNISLGVFALTLPVVICTEFSGPSDASDSHYLHHVLAFVASACTFFVIAVFYCVSEVARELDDPFINFPNELPLAHMQAECNKVLAHFAGRLDCWGGFVVYGAGAGAGAGASIRVNACMLVTGM